MKSNIVLKSEDRNLFGVVVRQETKTNFLNLTDLQNAYNKLQVENGWTEKRADHILYYNKSNQERIFYLLDNQGSINVGFHTFTELVDNQGGIIKYLKAINKYKMSGRGDNRSVWCDPLIWLLCAYEMHPIIYAKTLFWVHDNLVANRIITGDMYIELSKAVSKFDNVDYGKIGRAINYIALNKHEHGIRDTLSSTDLRKIERLETELTWAIENGSFNDYQHLLKYLRNEYVKRWRIK
jgi:hypothetical protein